MSATTFQFTDADGFQIFVYKWAPDEGKPKAAVQIVHGAAEHALRYERFARFLNQAGYVVYADDHRGHGKTAGELSKAGIAGKDGWNGMIKDEKQLSEIIQQENPGLPLFLFGHSMGSFLAQRYIHLRISSNYPYWHGNQFSFLSSIYWGPKSIPSCIPIGARARARGWQPLARIMRKSTSWWQKWTGK